MILILAQPDDEVARRLAERWGGDGAELVSPRQLSSPGWRHFPVGGGVDALPVRGRMVPTGEVRGVLSRIVAVTERDLGHIVAEDRAYVAAEMTAFLLSWLGALLCPVVNRPSAPSLNGPGWNDLRWSIMAARVGLRVDPRAASVRAGRHLGGPDVIQIKVIGSECMGAPSPSLADAALDLARSAGVDLLTVCLSGTPEAPSFLGVEPWADISPPPLADRVLALLKGATARAAAQ